MKLTQPSQWPSTATRLFCAVSCFFPTVLFAHPGHYHPDETDEFDSLRAAFFHSHGGLDYLLAALVVASIAVALFSARTSVRISALLAAMASLALLPAF